MFEGLQEERMQEDEQGAKKAWSEIEVHIKSGRPREKQYIMTLQNWS